MSHWDMAAIWFQSSSQLLYKLRVLCVCLSGETFIRVFDDPHRDRDRDREKRRKKERAGGEKRVRLLER